MNLTIHGNHVEVSPALRDHVTSKLTVSSGTSIR